MKRTSDVLKALGIFYFRKKEMKMGKKIYVANIPFNATEQDVKNLFAECGEIASVKIITDKFTGQSRGFGFVEMESENDAKKAISEINGKSLMGKVLVVAEARPQQTREREGFKGNREGFGGERRMPGGRGKTGRGRR